MFVFIPRLTLCVVLFRYSRHPYVYKFCPLPIQNLFKNGEDDNTLAETIYFNGNDDDTGGLGSLFLSTICDACDKKEQEENNFEIPFTLYKVASFSL